MSATKARNMKSNKKDLPPKQREELLKTLKARFEKNMDRHQGLAWAQVQAKLEANGAKLWSLNELKEPAVSQTFVGHDKNTGKYIFYDCSTEVLKAAEVFATTLKRWSQGKNINRQIMLLVWRLPWVLSF
jgi:hypothetical protein